MVTLDCRDYLAHLCGKVETEFGQMTTPEPTHEYLDDPCERPIGCFTRMPAPRQMSRSGIIGAAPC